MRCRSTSRPRRSSHGRNARHDEVLTIADDGVRETITIVIPPSDPNQMISIPFSQWQDLKQAERALSFWRDDLADMMLMAEVFMAVGSCAMGITAIFYMIRVISGK